MLGSPNLYPLFTVVLPMLHINGFCSVVCLEAVFPGKLWMLGPNVTSKQDRKTKGKYLRLVKFNYMTGL